MSTPTAFVRSFGVACYLLGRGYTLVGAEIRDGWVGYRFAYKLGEDPLREYNAAKSKLDALADAAYAAAAGSRS
jgi:hypothetical protein